MNNSEKTGIISYQMIFKGLYWSSLILVLFLAFSPRGADITPGINDKANHAIAFFVLICLSHQAYKTISLKQILFLIAFGLLIETVQYFLPYRKFSLYDMLANLTGIVIYIFILLIIRMFSSAAKND